jgi:hypothetical protein
MSGLGSVIHFVKKCAGRLSRLAEFFPAATRLRYVFGLNWF